MPYAFKDVDEKCNFLCVCLKSAMENGGKVDQASVASTLNYPKKKVTTFLSLVKKAADSLVSDNEGKATAEGNDEAAPPKDVQDSKKHKRDGAGESKEEKLPKAKKVKVEEEHNAVEETGEGDSSGDVETA